MRHSGNLGKVEAIMGKLFSYQFPEGTSVAPESILKRYEAGRDTYQSFSSALAALISQLLKLEGIEIHSVSHRCKTLASLKGKISKKHTYGLLEEITDLAGIRLITHYEDDVDKVARLIESEFKIDKENSIDKRIAMDPDRFGYLSLHYVVSLNDERASLRENQSYAGLKAEIQIRSILQHSWAEIEHDTGYKSEVEVPRHIRRRFSRLAGLLEIADREFIDLRNELASYAKEVSEKIENSASSVCETDVSPLPIDKVTLLNFVTHDPLVSKLDSVFANALGTTIDGLRVFDHSDISRLSQLSVHNLSDLQSALYECENLVLRRIEQVVRSFRTKVDFTIEQGSCLYMLLHVLIARRIPEGQRKTYLSENGYSATPEFLSALEEIASID